MRKTIYDYLRKDHDKVHDLLDQLVRADDQTDWRALTDQIAACLMPHSRAEEEVFYGSIREIDRGGKLVLHSYAEHAQAETDLRALQEMEIVDQRWVALARKLRSDLLHHVAEEEGKVFPAAMGLFSDEEAVALGHAFESLKHGVKGEPGNGARRAA